MALGGSAGAFVRMLMIGGMRLSHHTARLLERVVRRAESPTLLERLEQGDKPDSPATVALVAAIAGAGLAAVFGASRRRR